ncbi:GAF domain-containing protein [Leptolyngbya cf. ectocarpi LEGE 11479]|uniref:histidine kinase n=1 Tax=Leptolyngbya cf. ectocarpi LEGE 11479 TaxID=1828722 RepID=A0A928X008_LEPEC|nr:GAF domain-containing hybrid sensor histidine kinase/response regulator [Leptolyngbya ectocarpi]MBE9065361.1 GAF domain-containing protein [Leptolyngbya cf. ectocarpi LEGE 11479]
MSSFSSALEYQSVPRHVFEQLRRSLLGLLAGAISHLSEQELDDGQLLSTEANIEKFSLLSTGQTSLLLLAQPDGVGSYLVCLCTNPLVIIQFLSSPWLRKSLSASSRSTWAQLQKQMTVVDSFTEKSSQEVALDNHNLIKLIQQLVLEANGLEMLASVPTSLPPAATILQHVVARLQHSAPLSSVIQPTLDEVCEWLCLDRLFIYQIVNPPALVSQSHGEQQQSEEQSGDRRCPHVTYEARGHPSIDSILHHADAHCLNHKPWHQRYQNLSAPRYYAIENIATYYQQHACLVTQLQQAHVISQLVVPIWLEGNVWGLLIGHHCRQQNTTIKPRQWQPWEGNFLAQIAEHLAIAVRQSDLQEQLQYQKLCLKTKVEDRTQNLKDALMAAEAANKTKSEFLATMSHELRTPLTYIIGMSATLLRWSFGDLSPRQRDYLNTIHSSGEQLLDIINDILEVAKIEAGRTVLEINDFSLSNLARSSLESFREEAQAKGVDLRINLRLSDTDDSFRADPRRIRQILANLLSNAVKFTDKDGRISLRVWRDPQNVMFQVEDTGIGIPETQRASLFETFKQLETTRQRQYPGTGLGLALTKQLVELHNGSIQVVSTPGKGSMFTVRIPLQHSDSVPTSFQSVEPVTGRIILLEDDENSASLICDLLTAANYQVIWVIEGSRIVHQVEILQPVAIILNHHLVSGNSHYIVDDLKRYVAISGIKVISLMDAEDLEEFDDESAMEGFDDCLVKPIDPPTLLNTIQVLAQG